MRRTTVVRTRRLSHQGTLESNNRIGVTRIISKIRRPSYNGHLCSSQTQDTQAACFLKKTELRDFSIQKSGKAPTNAVHRNTNALTSRNHLAGAQVPLSVFKKDLNRNACASRDRGALRCESLQLRTVNLVDDWMLGYPPVSKFQEKYRVDSETEDLGVGSYGVVQRATCRKSGKEYALKRLKKMVSRSGKTLQKIRNEAKILTQLGPSLDVGFCYGVWEDAHEVYLLLEYCQGGAIPSGKMDEDRVRTIVKSILRLIGQCHAHDIIHRDIKPDNFLFLHDGEDSPVRAVDFGLATYLSPEGSLHDRCGTIHYCAPEVIKMNYGLKSDMWSLGVLSYQLLTGCLPFMPSPGKPLTNAEVFHRICNSQPSYDGPEWSGVSEDSKNFVRCLLQHDPKLRPSAVNAMHNRWLEDKPGSSSQLPLGGSVVQRLQRFGSYGRFKQLVMQKMAMQLVEEDQQLQGVRALFEEIDRSQKYVDLCFPEKDTGSDNFIHIVDLRVALLSAGYHVSKEEFFQLASSMRRLHLTAPDRREGLATDENLVDVHQFVAALIDWRQVEQDGRWEQLASNVFRTLDHSGSGYVNPQYLSEYLCELNGDRIGCCSAIRNLLREADSDGDEFVSLDDFLALVQPRKKEDNLELYDSRFYDACNGTCSACSER